MSTDKMCRLSFVLLTLLAIVPTHVAAAPPVQVTSADPAAAPQGSISLDVTVSGSGFDSSAAVSFLVTGTTNPGGVTVRRVSVLGPKKLLATIDIADAAVVSNFDIEVQLSGGRKGKGTSMFAVLKKADSDPCAIAGLDFPAFVYWKQIGATARQLLVADSTGTCSRPLQEIPSFLGLAFSHPVAGTTNQGRVVWTANSVLYGLDFTVSGTTVIVGTAQALYGPVGCCALDLSSDGMTVYVSTNDWTLSKIALDGSPSPVTVYQIAADGRYFASASLNGDETVIFTDEMDPYNSPSRGNKLVRVDLTGAAVPIVLHSQNPPYQYFQETDSSQDRLIYTDYLAGFNNCHLLQVIAGTGGPILNSGQPRYGTHSTWLDGKILTRGYLAPDRKGKCAFTDTIYQVDPATSAESPLIIGNMPDAR